MYVVDIAVMLEGRRGAGERRWWCVEASEHEGVSRVRRVVGVPLHVRHGGGCMIRRAHMLPNLGYLDLIAAVRALDGREEAGWPCASERSGQRHVQVPDCRRAGAGVGRTGWSSRMFKRCCVAFLPRDQARTMRGMDGWRITTTTTVMMMEVTNSHADGEELEDDDCWR